MALPFSFQFNPRRFPSFVRRFLFHAIIHNNNRQDCFFFLLLRFYRIFGEHIYQFSSLFTEVRWLASIVWASSPSDCYMHPDISISCIHSTHTRTQTHSAEVYQITSDAQNGIVSLRERARARTAASMRKRLCVRSSWRTKKIIKSATGRKEFSFLHVSLLFHYLFRLQYITCVCASVSQNENTKFKLAKYICTYKQYLAMGRRRRSCDAKKYRPWSMNKLANEISWRQNNNRENTIKTRKMCCSFR